MMSDESENDATFPNTYEDDIYYKKYKLLLDECSHFQKSNEILVFRIQEINKIVRRRQKEVDFFKNRLLTNYGEEWRELPNAESIHEEKTESVTGVVQKDKADKVRHKKEPPVEISENETGPKSKKPARRRTGRSEKDPNAPKRPSNPFFQFCQEQRPILMEQLSSELKPGEAELTKQELTKQLAIKWKSLSGDDKQIYVDMYERSKEKYAMELSMYNMKK